MASDCGFGIVLDNMIRNQLVCGIRDANVRTRLLQIAELSLQQAIETAIRAESALRHVRDMYVEVSPIHSLSEVSHEKSTDFSNHSSKKVSMPVQ